jgi:hypothetical protein
MVKFQHRLQLACALALLPVSLLSAKDLAAYRLGDTAEENLTTPVALDVINPEATTARRAAEALKTPAIFRSYPDLATNAVAIDFQTTFAATRSNFLAALKGSSGAAPRSDKKPDPSEFDKLITAFNARNKSFPVSWELADAWAHGNAGLEVQNRLTGALLKMMHRPICSDTLPPGFVVGDTLRLAPANDPSEMVTLEAAERDGKLVTGSSLTTLSRLRMLMRREFPDNEQALARALGTFLAPNCVPDPALTQQARDREASQLVVVNHYNAGETIIRRGQVIDTKAKAALDQLHDRAASGLLNQQIAAEHDLAQRAQQQAQQEHDRAQLEQTQAQQARAQAQAEHERMLKFQEQALSLQTQASKIRASNEWLIIALAGISAVSLLAFWRQSRQRPRPGLLPVRRADLPPQNQVAVQPEFAPHLARVIKEALVQELAAQRNELIQAQRTAALEIAGLVHRLDELQTPLHERLRAYETRIQELEKELTARNEENRELLKLKIEMIRRQIEAERAAPRLGFN